MLMSSSAKKLQSSYSAAALTRLNYTNYETAPIEPRGGGGCSNRGGGVVVVGRDGMGGGGGGEQL